MPEPIRHWEPAAEAIEQWLSEQGITLAELKRSDRRMHMVDARRKVARYLHDHGWSLVRIGDYLDRDHTTALKLIRGRGWADRESAV